LASYLTIFFHDQYAVSPVAAGDLTTVVVLFGSFLRPVGGLLADRFGGYRLLLFLLGGISVCLTGMATLPAVQIAMMFLILTMAMLGMGNGAVFQLVPQRFPKQVGIMTGIVGAAGGLGGFFLPSMLGAIKGRTGTFALGFAIFAVIVLAGVTALFRLGRVWRNSWSVESALRAGLLPEMQDETA